MTCISKKKEKIRGSVYECARDEKRFGMIRYCAKEDAEHSLNKLTAKKFLFSSCDKVFNQKRFSPLIHSEKEEKDEQ